MNCNPFVHASFFRLRAARTWSQSSTAATASIGAESMMRGAADGCGVVSRTRCEIRCSAAADGVSRSMAPALWHGFGLCQHLLVTDISSETKPLHHATARSTVRQYTTTHPFDICAALHPALCNLYPTPLHHTPRLPPPHNATCYVLPF